MKINKELIDHSGYVTPAVTDNKYLRLFTITFTTTWKSKSVFFTLTNGQNNSYSKLIQLYCRRGSSDVVEIIKFSAQNVDPFLKSNLVAIAVGNSKVEVYLKVGNVDSPMLDILSAPEFHSTITVDMNTTVSSLPSGTAVYIRETEDTGWVTITFDTNTYFSARSGAGYAPKYRKIGNVVYLQGQFQVKSALTGLTNYTITNMNLPAPDHQYSFTTGGYQENIATGWLVNNTMTIRPYKNWGVDTIGIAIDGCYISST